MSEETVSFVFPRVLSRGKHQDLRESKTNWFPGGPDIMCFVIFLDFHFNSKKGITGANQNSRLGSYKNTNLILTTTEWMIYKVISLYHLHHFPPLLTSCCFSSGITLKIVAFLAWGFMFVLRTLGVFTPESENWQCFSRLLSRLFPPCFDRVL